jgi:hypothetical protein
VQLATADLTPYPPILSLFVRWAAAYAGDFLITIINIIVIMIVAAKKLKR